MTAPQDLVAFVTTDLVALTRGRAVAQSALPGALSKGVGWVPANLALTPFDEIAHPNPFGSSGDLRLMPDPDAGVRVTGPGLRGPLHFYHSDIVNLDGTPWEGCVRSLLKSAVDALAALGLKLVAAFEQEFQLLDLPGRPAPSFALSALRRVDPFGPTLMAALDEACCAPECFLPEYGRNQFEIVCAPASALVAADRAVTIREVTRDIATQLGHKASFCPKTDPADVGNGVHIHLSLTDLKGPPVTFDPSRPGRLSARAGAFAAGIVRHMAALTALAAPSAVSYQRLKPHTWSAAWTTLGERDREATLRICPTSERPGHDPSASFNMEFRAADATASPHLALAMLIRAGIAGLVDGLDTPPITRGDPEEMTPDQRAALGIRRLPSSLPQALDALQADTTVCGWLSPRLLDCWVGLRHKELALVQGLDDAALCRRYAEIY